MPEVPPHALIGQANPVELSVPTRFSQPLLGAAKVTPFSKPEAKRRFATIKKLPLVLADTKGPHFTDHCFGFLNGASAKRNNLSGSLDSAKRRFPMHPFS